MSARAALEDCFRSSTLPEHIEFLEPHLAVVKPPGPGPFPVSLQFHGCGGVLSTQFEYAEAACRVGVAAVVVDSLAPRGISRVVAQATICTGARFRGAERARDVLAALTWARSQPWADPNRVALCGWSHGGWAVMEAMSDADQVAPPVKAAVLFYPYCGPFSRTASRGWGGNKPAVFACLGGRDVVVGTALPRRALSRLQSDGLAVRTLFLKEAPHGFDEYAPDQPPTRFRPELAVIARDFYAEALRSSL